MERCIYCGKKEVLDKKVDQKYFVCSQKCKEKVTKYIYKENKYQNILFIVYAIITVLIIINSLRPSASNISYLLVALIGLLLFLFPYTRVMKETLNNIIISNIILGNKLVGVLFIMVGLGNYL